MIRSLRFLNNIRYVFIWSTTPWIYRNFGELLESTHHGGVSIFVHTIKSCVIQLDSLQCPLFGSELQSGRETKGSQANAKQGAVLGKGNSLVVHLQDISDGDHPDPTGSPLCISARCPGILHTNNLGHLSEGICEE